MYIRSLKQVFGRVRQPPELRLFAARRLFLLLQKCIAASKRHLKRNKKEPTYFYKKREHTAEGSKVHRSGSSTSSPQIFVFPIKIFSFNFERVIDQANKFYEGKESQTLNFGSCLIAYMLLGFDGFIQVKHGLHKGCTFMHA